MEKYEKLTILFQSKNKILKMKTNAVSVKAGQTFELPLVISKAGTTVHWVFHSKGYDIRFGIAKAKNGLSRDYFVGNNIYPADSPQQGKVVFPQIGDYFLVWDNTYSWFHEKNVVYSIEIILPDLTLDERVQCARTILADMSNMKREISECQQQEKEKKSHLTELERQREEKKMQLEELKRDIVEVDEKMKSCNVTMTALRQKASEEAKSIEKLAVASPFLLEGDRIVSLLSGPDLLRLGCVNRLMNKAVSRDSVWLRSFRQDSKEDLSIVVKNEWVFRKWTLLNPGVELPKEVDPHTVPKKETEK